MKPSTRLTIAALLAFALTPWHGIAQGAEPTKPDTQVQAVPSQPKWEPHPYTVLISIKESDSGKIATEKSYALTVTPGDSRFANGNVRDGDKIPYMSDKGRQWVDVGTNIDLGAATLRGEALAFSLDVDSSSLVAKTNGVDLPQVNQWRIRVAPLLLPGKPTVVYSATDATTGRKVEVQATVMPLGAK